MEKSVGMDVKTYNSLSKIAESNNRSIVGQIRFWVKLEVKK